MDQIRSLSQMIEEAKKLCASKGKKRVSVAMAEDAGLISAIEEARRTGLVEATLVGNVEKVKACIAEAGASEKDYTIIDEKNEAKCGLVAVTEVSSKRADIYMKGQLHTDHFLSRPEAEGRHPEEHRQLRPCPGRGVPQGGLSGGRRDGQSRHALYPGCLRAGPDE